MSATSVGQIGLDLVVNQKQFNKQMSGIQSLASKVGKTLAGAFAVKKIVDFGKECVNLGSDLQEVQNVVDVVFPNMTEKINEFSQSAATSFGLSETMAKKFTGTYGAMAKAFGFTEDAAYEMSTTLTGLAGDVASFYNITQDEAYTKLKSVFTGETETLKDLGVVMTQSALDSYALANGFGKVTSAMSEAEKVALRYSFVQEKLAAAQGDFTRTSDGWANQVRILKLQFDSLKATIGQGLIAAFTPVIKVINTVLLKVQGLANAFKNLMEGIFGKQSSETSAFTNAVESASQAAADTASSTGTTADNLKKAKGSLAGFDKLNNLSTDTSSSGSGSGSGSGVSGSGLSETITDVATETEDVLNPVLDKLSKKFKELQDIFKAGFKISLGDANLESVVKAADGIKATLKDIFETPEVLNAANNFANRLAYSFGQQAGAVASMGVTIATNLLGGIDEYLANNQERIKQFIINMFDIDSDIATIRGNFAQAIANIFSVVGEENGQQATANIIGIFSDAAMGILELSAKLGRDVLDCITKPFIDNQDEFKTAIDGSLGIVSEVFKNIKQVVDDTIGKAREVYDEHLAPMFSSIAEGLSTIVGTVLDAYNTYILPVQEEFQQKVSQLINDHVQPAINKGLELIGKIADAVKDIWEKILLPFIKWFIANVAPYIAKTLEKAGDAFLTVAEVISDVIGNVFDALGGLIDFVVGVFTGDWKRAWEGIKTFFSGIWGAIKSIVSSVWNAIKSTISTNINAVSSVIRTVLNTIKSVFSTIWNSISSTVSSVINGIKSTIITVIKIIQTGISTALSSIKTNWNNMWNNMKTTVVNIFNGIWSSIKGIINSIIGGIESMANAVIKGINSMIKALNNLKFDVPDWIPGIGGKSFGLKIPTISTVSIPRLAQGGYVKPNTPQLAMIGDNRHQGEVVAPEDKLTEMALNAAKMAGGNFDYTLLKGIIDLLEQMVELLSELSEKDIGIAEKDLFNSVRKNAKLYKDRTGNPAFPY